MKNYTYKVVQNSISWPLRKDYLKDNKIGSLMTTIMANYVIKHFNSSL